MRAREAGAELALHVALALEVLRPHLAESDVFMPLSTTVASTFQPSTLLFALTLASR